MIPLALAVVVFAVANRAPVILDLWPMPLTLDVPVFALALAGGMAGFLAGALITWLSGGRRRAAHRRVVRELEALKRQEAALRAQMRHAEQAPAPVALITDRNADAA